MKKGNKNMRKTNKVETFKVDVQLTAISDEKISKASAAFTLREAEDGLAFFESLMNFDEVDDSNAMASSLISESITEILRTLLLVIIKHGYQVITPGNKGGE